VKLVAISGGKGGDRGRSGGWLGPKDAAFVGGEVKAVDGEHGDEGG